MILRVYELPMAHTFRISRQSFDTKRSLIVELQDGIHSGYGEASENPYYGKTIEDMVADLKAAREAIELSPMQEPSAFWSEMQPLLKNDLFALCALDMAYHDLYARKKGKKLYELLGLNTSHNPLSNFTIGIDRIENMVNKMKQQPWPIYKIKLGTDHDLEIVKALRKHSSAIFRIDANCAWTVEQTLDLAPKLKALGVEFLEQPLPADDLEGSKLLYKRSVLPIIADESCQVESDVEQCFKRFHGVNIKLVKCGGITPALRMLRKAALLKMKRMVGCMTESSVGISAIAHLLPLLDYVDMDGAVLLRSDPASGVTLRQGKVIYSALPGIGVELDTGLAKVTYE